MDLTMRIKVNVSLYGPHGEHRIRRAVEDCGQLHVVSVAEIEPDLFEVNITILNGMMNTEQAVSNVKKGLMNCGICTTSISYKGNFGEWKKSDNYSGTDYYLSLMQETNELNARRQSTNPMIGSSPFSVFHKPMHPGGASSSTMNRFIKPRTTHDEQFDEIKRSSSGDINLYSMNTVQSLSFLNNPNIDHSAVSSPASTMAENAVIMSMYGHTSYQAHQPSWQEDDFNPMKPKGRFG